VPVGRQEGLNPLPLPVRKFSSRHAASIATESRLVKLLLGTTKKPFGPWTFTGSTTSYTSARGEGEVREMEMMRRRSLFVVAVVIIAAAVITTRRAEFGERCPLRRRASSTPTV